MLALLFFADMHTNVIFTGKNVMSESVKFEKYQSVIKSLLPYANEGRLLQGLNKFTGKLSSSVRKSIKSEVERLMSDSNQGADNSDFAVFPVREFKHFGLDMRLDEIGESILLKETKRYFDRYTVGVHESITSSKEYQQRLKIVNNKKIVEHFSVDAQPLNDIEFGDDIAVLWSENVGVDVNNKIERYLVTSLSLSGITIESRRIFGLKKGMHINVHVDKKSYLPFKGATLACECGVSNFNRDTNKHELSLAFTSATLQKIKVQLKSFLETISERVPLIDTLEHEKTTQAIERDILLESSPWIPLFISDDGLDIKVLMTKQNIKLNQKIATADHIPRKRVLERIIKEFEHKDEIYLFRAKIEHNKVMIDIVATITQLLSAGLLETFLYHARRTGNLTITQLRAKSLDAHALSKIPTSAIENKGAIDSLAHVIFARDVTQNAAKLLPSVITEIKPLPRLFIDDSETLISKTLLHPQLDRRSEPRFMLQKPLKITLSIFKKLDGELLDLSPSGLKIRIPSSRVRQLPSVLKIDISAIGIRTGKYNVITKCPKNGIVRLCVAGTNEQKNEIRTLINDLITKNEEYFSHRDKKAVERKEFAQLWEVATRYQPSLGVICANSANPNHHMKGVYAESSLRDAGPFKGDGTRLYMHGIFADVNTDSTRSSLLAGMLNNTIKQKSIIHCRLRRKNNIVPITNEQFFKVSREAIKAMCTSKQAGIYVIDVQCCRVDLSQNNVIHNHVNWLKEHSPRLGRVFEKSLSSYSHVIFCTDVSLLHNALLMHSHSTEVEKGEPNSNTDIDANRSVA